MTWTEPGTRECGIARYDVWAAGVSGGGARRRLWPPVASASVSWSLRLLFAPLTAQVLPRLH